MFHCIHAPKEPHFEADLAKLGFKYANGQFISIEPPHDHFDYYYSDNERVNDRRKEAMHECARAKVAEELTKFNIHPLYLTGEGGIIVRHDKPEEPHVQLFATEVSALRKKKDVVVVVGEAAAGQDAGVWAYRLLMREGGVEHGSAVGLAARIAAYEQSLRDDDFEVEFEVESLTETTAQLSFKEEKKVQDDTTPGLIVLNPGQLLYSHLEGTPMSQVSWLARERPSALDDEYDIDSEYNRIPGHKNRDQHAVTVIEHVLPQLIREDSRLYIVCIGDGAKSTIDWLDQTFVNEPDSGLAKQLESVVLIQPDFEPWRLVSEPFKHFLAVSAKSWVHCPDLPYGRLIQVPEPVKAQASLDHFRAAQFPSGANTWNTSTQGSVTDQGSVKRADSVSRTTTLSLAITAPQSTEAALSDVTNVKNDGNTTTSEHLDAEPELITKDEALSADSADQTHPQPSTDTTANEDDDPSAEPEYVDVKDEAYSDHADEQVLCATFSAGDCEGITEIIWPRVMGDALEFFWYRKAVAEKYERMRAGGEREWEKGGVEY